MFKLYRIDLDRVLNDAHHGVDLDDRCKYEYVNIICW